MPLASNEEPSTPQGYMTAEDALELFALFENNGIAVCIDGGWGVDALVGQTRLHADLDTRDCNFVLGDASGREVDIHSYTFDSRGNLVYGIAYPPDSLTGTGTQRPTTRSSTCGSASSSASRITRGQYTPESASCHLLCSSSFGPVNAASSTLLGSVPATLIERKQHCVWVHRWSRFAR
jgi:hypothetical protein